MNITSNSVSDTGVLVGYMTGTLECTHATGDISITKISETKRMSNIGGLAGNMIGSVFDSYATGNAEILPEGEGVNSRASNVQKVGGLIGYYTARDSEQKISNVFAEGAVTGGYQLGGLIGYTSGYRGFNLSNAYALGDVSSVYVQDDEYVYVGGLIGQVGDGGAVDASAGEVRIANVYAYGDVSAINGGGVGGLIGYITTYQTSKGVYQSGSITNAHAYGDVSVTYIDAEGAYGVGGLIGTMSSIDLSNSSASGDVYGFSHVGGLVGTAARSTISDSYATGAASSVENKVNYGSAGLVANMNESTVYNSYYNADVNDSGYHYKSENAGVDGISALTGEQVNDAQYYANNTIDQVLSARAEVAAQALREQQFRQSATAAGSKELGQGQKNTATRPPTVEQAWQSVAAQLDGNIEISTPQLFGADISSMEVDGHVFQLEEEDDK